MDDFDLLAIQDKTAVENSFFRSPKVLPSISRLDSYTIQVSTADARVKIKRLQELVLSIIASFKYSPYWLIQQWYASQGKDATEDILNFISTGLLFVDTSATGIYLRPTRFLLDLFEIKDAKYEDIPYRLLVHDVSEQQILFDIQIGNKESELWYNISKDNLLPAFHPLQLAREDGETGTIAIREADFRLGYKRYSNSTLLENAERIKKQADTGISVTDEFKDFTLFPIVKFNQLEQDGKGSVITQTPDVLVPIFRNNGRAKSCAIEIELTPKTPDKYYGIMDSYKDNFIYGKLFYLCGSQRVSKLVLDAYHKIGGLGNCELLLMEFIPPAMRLDNFSASDVDFQKKLIEVNKDA